ncbi:MAG: murein biosynthesis integral membrane protein MurJ [Planctomycetota bacterium]|nr:murein biosynthesis integral membrane protein MurJ [Planctomycetota bacterium]
MSHSTAKVPGNSGLSRLLLPLRTVSTITLVSRVLGLLRDISTAAIFGMGNVMDAFALAFRIPNLSRRLLGEGALSAAFLPVFIDRRQHHGTEASWHLASAVLSLLTLLLCGLVILGLTLCGLLYQLNVNDPHLSFLVTLTSLLLPFMIFICLSAQIAAMLNALGHFALPALSPVLINVGWLITLWGIAPWISTSLKTQCMVMSCGIVFSAFIQLGFQTLFLWRYGFRFQSPWRADRLALTTIFNSLVPMLLGLSIVQINGFLDSLIAWLLAQPEGQPLQFHVLGYAIAYPMLPGSVSCLYFAERVYQFPVGVFGVAVGTVIYPLLSRHASERNTTALVEDLIAGLRLVLIIGIPASAGLVVLAKPIAALLFQHGQFSVQDTIRAAFTLQAYAVGISAYCCMPVLVRAFYATGNHSTPVQIGLAVVLLNLVLNLLLVWPMGEAGLALGTALTATLQAILLGICLVRSKKNAPWKSLGNSTIRAIFATVIMTVVIFLTDWLCQSSAVLQFRLIQVLLPLTAGMGSYFLIGHFLGFNEVFAPFFQYRQHKTRPDTP